MKNEYKIGEFSRALKTIYGEECELEIVQPFITFAGGGIQLINSFKEKTILVLRTKKKEEKDNCILISPDEIVINARKDGAIVLGFPREAFIDLGKDEIKFDYTLCLKFPDHPFYIPRVDIESAKNVNLNKEFLAEHIEKNPKFKEIIEVIDKGFKPKKKNREKGDN